jgi:hypothetical protein
MNERENFLARWSRRKQAAAQEGRPETSPASAAIEPSFGEPTRPAVDPVRPRPLPLSEGSTLEREADAGAAHAELPSAKGGHVLDLTGLPPIESITADTDISGFLAPGVPTELTRAALRRAWSADPRIRDFIGPSENSWDFNAPDAMGGFGPLEMTDELRRQILEMVGRGLDPPDAPDPAITPDPQPSLEPPPDQPMTTRPALPTEQGQEIVQVIAQVPQALIEPTRDNASGAHEENDDRDPAIVKRPRGRALPR